TSSVEGPNSSSRSLWLAKKVSTSAVNSVGAPRVLDSSSGALDCAATVTPGTCANDCTPSTKARRIPSYSIVPGGAAAISSATASVKTFVASPSRPTTSPGQVQNWPTPSVTDVV